MAHGRGGRCDAHAHDLLLGGAHGDLSVCLPKKDIYISAYMALEASSESGTRLTILSFKFGQVVC